MSKKSKIQEIPLNLDEESVEKSRFAGMLKRDIEAAASAVAAHKAKSAELSGDLSAKLENFVNKGGHKSALKAAEKLAGMESAEAQDWLRSFQAYLMAGCALITYSFGTNPLAEKPLRTYRIAKKSLPISCKINSSTMTIRSMSNTIFADLSRTQTITSSPEYMRFQIADTMTRL